MSPAVALVFHTLLAGVCAYNSRGRLDARGEWLGVPFLVVLAFTTLLSTPTTVFFMRFYPAWFVHFSWDPMADPDFESASLVYSALWMVALVAATVAGFALARWGIARMHPPYCLLPLAPVALLGAVGLVLLGGRVAFVGDHEQFLSGALRPLHTHVVGLLSALLVASGAVTTWKCRSWFLVDTGGTSLPPTSVA